MTDTRMQYIDNELLTTKLILLHILLIVDLSDLRATSLSNLLHMESKSNLC